jgi:hypothetical protein
MSLISYFQSREISFQDDWDFSAYIMCALRKADSRNHALLTLAFPDIADEFTQRYSAPSGCLTEAEENWLEEYYETDQEGTSNKAV